MGMGETNQAAGAAAAAIEANWVALYSAFRVAPGVEVEDRPEYVRTLSGVPSPFFNAVFRARFDSSETDTQIEAALAPFKTGDLPLIWVVGPTSRPSELGARLEAHGLVHVMDMVGMERDLQSAPVPSATAAGLTVRVVEDETTLRQWAEPVTVGFELGEAGREGLQALYGDPRLRAAGVVRSYVGLVEDAPVAAATLFLGAAEAGIYNVATMPMARRRGFAAVLTARALMDARAHGFRTAVLQSTPEGMGVYRRLGFRGDSVFGLYIWLGSAG